MNINEATEALQDLYDIIEKSQKRNVTLSEDTIKRINEAEEEIIRNDILPAMSNDIEPRLSLVKRDLVLVVEYHPGLPISVALSRKAKISQISDARTITQTTQKIGEPVVSAKMHEKEQNHEPTKRVLTSSMRHPV